MSIFRSRIECIATCYKGGGGGGSSGKSDFPDYMKNLHSEWLSNGNAAGVPNVLLSAGNDITSLLDSAISTSPYQGEVAYNPDVDIATFVSALNTFETDLGTALDWDVLLSTANTQVSSVINDSAAIDAVTAAHGAILDDRLISEVLPRFQAGMRDINAVVSSSFVTGQAILEAFNTREVAEFDAKLRLQSQGQNNQYVMEGVKDQLELLKIKLSMRESIAKVTIEAMRIKVVMKKEEIDDQLDMDEKDYRWGLDLFQHGANVLGSIAGSAVSNQKVPSKTSSVLGGALSGAASGAMIGGPVGAGVGAVLGGLGGLF